MFVIQLLEMRGFFSHQNATIPAASQREIQKQVVRHSHRTQQIEFVDTTMLRMPNRSSPLHITKTTFFFHRESTPRKGVRYFLLKLADETRLPFPYPLAVPGVAILSPTSLRFSAIFGTFATSELTAQRVRHDEHKYASFPHLTDCFRA